MKETIYGIIAFITLPLIIGGCVYLCTTPEYWYAGMHDGMCEKTHGEKCQCYQRALERDRNVALMP